MMLLLTLFLIVFVFGCAIYANLSRMVTRQANFRYFPPFRPFVDANRNHHLGAEYYNIARAIVAGEGFANPWGVRSGPTAWMPPVLPGLLALLLWVCNGDRELVMAVVVFLQIYVLLGTGVLVLLLVRQTATRGWALVGVVVFLILLVSDFRLWFQQTHDNWLVLLALDLLIAGFVWLRPLQNMLLTAGWGFFGGLCALVNPIVGLAWGLATALLARRQGRWRPGVVAGCAALLTVMPWVVRNAVVFGRLVSVKSNLAYEMYQSQCLQKDGLLQDFAGHPYGSAGMERQDYLRLGEVAFLERRRDTFWNAVRARPEEFIERVAFRFVGVTAWYVPFERTDETRRPVVTLLSRLVHPLPLLGAVALGVSAFWRRLPPARWIALVLYGVYLAPYILISYYERYGAPLLGVKVLLVVWGLESFVFLGIGLVHYSSGGRRRRQIS